MQSSLNSSVFVYVDNRYVVHLCSKTETGFAMKLKLVSITGSRCYI